MVEKMQESKTAMWNEIQSLSRKDPIVSSAFELHAEGMIEDKEGILMRIVLMQQEQITAMQLTQKKLIENKYESTIF